MMNIQARVWSFLVGSFVAMPWAMASGAWNVAVPESASSATVRLAAPDGTVSDHPFQSARDVATLDPLFLLGESRMDGLYRYEVNFGQTLTAEQTQVLAQSRQQGSSTTMAGQPEPLESVSGSFRISNGALLVPETSEPRAGAAGSSKSSESPNYQVIADDLIVQSSLCVGFDCVNNESFGSDTIRLKENALRIKFEDTSTGAFPGGDWQLTINDLDSGGQDRFSIENTTLGRVPFTVAGSAPNNTLYLDSTGNVGLGTAVPVLDLSLRATDTPAIRLEQSGAGGFTPQTWDIGANEASFFVRDVTAGSRLPFRILPGAPSNSLRIQGNGNIGIGTDVPQAKLHVAGDAYVAGTLTQLSSRSAKTNLVAVASDAVLDQLSRLPLWTWNYLSSDTQDRHIGPVAEDFYATFGFGTSAMQLAPSDVAGVALAASQALQREVAARDQTIAELEARLARLEAILMERKADGSAAPAAQ